MISRLFKQLAAVVGTAALAVAMILVVARGLSAGIPGQSRSPGQQAAIPATGVPGDVNGDGVTDISDPVALLDYLFNGGATPATCFAQTAPGFVLTDAEVAILRGVSGNSRTVGGPAPFIAEGASFPNSPATGVPFWRDAQSALQGGGRIKLCVINTGDVDLTFDDHNLQHVLAVRRGESAYGEVEFGAAVSQVFSVQVSKTAGAGEVRFIWFTLSATP
ncbi:MAG: hypothetical protein AB7O52_17370 [Planctomycetota bacterium]